MKRGGKPKEKMEGKSAKHHMGKRKRGGKVVAKSEKTAPMEDDDMPKRAEGGRVKKPSQTTVNVMMGPDKSAAPPQQVPVPVKVPVPVPQAGPPPGAPPMPPQGIPPGGPPPGAMPPPGMMARAKGGKVTKGTKTYEEGLKNGTQVSHAPGKNDAEWMGETKPVIPVRSGFARGGMTSESMGMGPKMDAGAGSGDGRLEKIGIQKRRG
jgi:hypothetical protein